MSEALVGELSCVYVYTSYSNAIRIIVTANNLIRVRDARDEVAVSRGGGQIRYTRLGKYLSARS